MKNEIININPEILGGTPVFRGTRVPIESLFLHLQKGISLDEFLEDFPTVEKEQAIKILKLAERIFSSKDIETLYENIAG